MSAKASLLARQSPLASAAEQRRVLAAADGVRSFDDPLGEIGEHPLRAPAETKGKRYKRTATSEASACGPGGNCC